ncbi:hypothetical protein JL721_7896 [Aureococcus anophagefferens]|nr:hypothetical protein JL721_7896 [Aureococcus anophagefferens]
MSEAPTPPGDAKKKKDPAAAELVDLVQAALDAAVAADAPLRAAEVARSDAEAACAGAGAPFYDNGGARPKKGAADGGGALRDLRRLPRRGRLRRRRLRRRLRPDRPRGPRGRRQPDDGAPGGQEEAAHAQVRRGGAGGRRGARRDLGRRRGGGGGGGVRGGFAEAAAAAASRTIEATKPKKAEAVEKEEASTEMVVDPFNVSGKIDYDKLIDKFGSTLLTPSLLDRLGTLARKRGMKLHRFLRRGIFFSHRDLEKILTAAETGQGLYLYTGRGPSSAAMHLGHLVPFLMTRWLQAALGVPLVVQMTDDEKFLWKGEYDEAAGDYDLDRFRELTVQNAKDIIACGFDKDRTFIFSDVDYMGHMYPNAAPSFPSTFKVPLGNRDDLACLIPCAIDQDPYFRVTRDIAHKIAPKTHPLKGKPALIHSKFFPPLQGAMGKMSSSDDNSAIFLTDDDATIERKIMTHAFSGGRERGGKRVIQVRFNMSRETAKLQRELGADLEVDVAFQWLKFFLEDDGELASIEAQYGSGSGDYWNTAAVKKRLVVELQGLVKDHQAKRNVLTDADVASWMAVRELAPAL